MTKPTFKQLKDLYFYGLMMCLSVFAMEYLIVNFLTGCVMLFNLLVWTYLFVRETNVLDQDPDIGVL